MDSVIKLQNLKTGGTVQILTETQEDRKLKVEVTEHKNTNANMVKILTDNVFAIKLMLSIQDVNDHLAKCTTIPESWHSKNYTFEFAERINSVIEKQLLDELCKSRFHMLIVDESTAFYCSQYL
jgi:hypothetical protein